MPNSSEHFRRSGDRWRRCRASSQFSVLCVLCKQHSIILDASRLHSKQDTGGVLFVSQIIIDATHIRNAYLCPTSYTLSSDWYTRQLFVRVLNNDEVTLSCTRTRTCTTQNQTVMNVRWWDSVGKFWFFSEKLLPKMIVAILCFSWSESFVVFFTPIKCRESFIWWMHTCDYNNSVWIMRAIKITRRTEIHLNTIAAITFRLTAIRWGTQR